MNQTKANYIAEWLCEEAGQSLSIEDVWNFIAVNLPEAEQAWESVYADELALFHRLTSHINK